MSRGKKSIKNFLKKIKNLLTNKTKFVIIYLSKVRKKQKRKNKKIKKMLDKPLKRCYNKYVKNK